MGNKKCIHGRQLRYCKECEGGGTGFCKHGKRRDRCAPCGGGSVCEHGREHAICKECDGNAICKHGKIRRYCRPCGGSSFCRHGKRRENCVECDGSGICRHKKRRGYCKECGGSALCLHDKVRRQCKQCDGASFCKHGRQGARCKECDGSGLCKHGRQRPQCAECGGSRICRGHPISKCGRLGNPKYDMHCTHCFRNLFPEDPRTAGIHTNSKEIQWVNALLQSPVLAGLEWRWDKPFYMSFAGGCCDTKRRIDLWTILGNVLVAVEIDEFQHKEKAVDYEEVRYNDLAMDFTGRQVYLRVNPDGFKRLGVRENPSFEERFPLVERKLEEMLDDIAEERDDASAMVQVHHMFYDE